MIILWWSAGGAYYFQSKLWMVDWGLLFLMYFSCIMPVCYSSSRKFHITTCNERIILCKSGSGMDSVVLGV